MCVFKISDVQNIFKGNIAHCPQNTQCFVYYNFTDGQLFQMTRNKC